jgi:hypothetical protein
VNTSFIKLHLDNFLQEIEKIKEYDFPYPHSLEALKHIEGKARAHLSRIGDLDSGIYNDATMSVRIAPASAMLRYPFYPDLKTRAKHLRQMSVDLKINVPVGFFEDFKDSITPTTWSEEIKYYVRISDKVTASYVEALKNEAIKIFAEAKIREDKPECIEKAVASLLDVVPIDCCETVSGIMNAAWEAFQKSDKWSDYPEIKAKEHFVLSDLVIKSFEIMEVNDRISKR